MEPYHHARPIRAGVFSDVRRADDAVARLLAAGFTKDQISVVCSDEAIEEHFREYEHQDPAGTHTRDTALEGGAIGALVGGLTLGGVATAAGVAVLAAGPIFAVAGAVAGGLIGAMMSRGVERELADFYDQAVTEGRILVAVEDHSEQSAERLTEAEHLFEAAGAEPFELEEE